MSLIQEALKRQQEDDGQGPPASAPPPTDAAPPSPPATPPAAPPATPPPVAPPPVAPPPPAVAAAPPPPTPPAAETDADDSTPNAGTGKKDGKPWVVLVGIVVIGLLLLGGIAWGVMFAYKQWAGTPPPEVVENDPTGTPGEPDPVDPPATVSPVNVSPDIMPVVEPVAGDPAPVETAPVNTNPTEMTPPDSFLPPEPEPTVVWPPLTLTGIVGKGATGSAMINGDVIGVNQRIEGARVVSIGDQGVTLEYQGKTRFLTVGASTN